MDIDAFRSAASAIPQSGPSPREQTPKGPTKAKVAPYLSGPVPMSWLAEAVSAGGAALALGVALWFHRGLRKKFGPILRVDAAARKVVNLTADQARRAVAALADRRLIHIHAGGRGRCAEVEILYPPGSAPSVDLRKPRKDAVPHCVGQQLWHETYDQTSSTQRHTGEGTPHEGGDRE